MELDTTNWSGEGTFTQTLIDALDAVEQVSLLRVEDASSSRSDVEFNFISNELFLRFGTRDRQVRAKMLGIVPVTRTVTEPAMRSAATTVSPTQERDVGMVPDDPVTVAVARVTGRCSVVVVVIRLVLGVRLVTLDLLGVFSRQAQGALTGPVRAD